MLGKAFKEWKAHFGFYISLITIQVILILLITMVSSWFSPMENMLLNTTDTANTDYSHIIYQLNKDSSWPIKLFLLTLFSGLIQAGAFLLLLGPVFLVSGNQMTPMKLGFVTVFALIITLIVSTLFISINYK